ncbi:MAG: LEA type 2 family protein [Deltaproteobacteria bacterium]|nr:LEA type 2 family protein [Deltaproteobacteria bacterium]MCW5804628.1 LEA type 2 family protein [Deltaproteobacteria bacterium]
MLRRLAVAALLTLAVGCRPGKSPELTVIGVVDESARREVVVVQVTNPASRPMRLTKLEYTFASGSETVAQGAIELSRDVPAGSAVVVEVPFDGDSEGRKVTLRGTLTAELDQIFQKFEVSAEVTPISAFGAAAK